MQLRATRTMLPTHVKRNYERSTLSTGGHLRPVRFLSVRYEIRRDLTTRCDCWAETRSVYTVYCNLRQKPTPWSGVLLEKPTGGCLYQLQCSKNSRQIMSDV